MQVSNMIQMIKSGIEVNNILPKELDLIMRTSSKGQ